MIQSSCGNKHWDKQDREPFANRAPRTPFIFTLEFHLAFVSDSAERGANTGGRYLQTFV